MLLAVIGLIDHWPSRSKGCLAMETRQLEYFLAVADELNFTRAAASLFVVQSTLSAGIRALEAEVGVALFERSTRRVEPTAAGLSLVPEARAVVDAVDRLRSIAAENASGIRGRVRVGIFSNLDVLDLPRLLGEYHRRHPLVDLVLSVSATGSTGLAAELRHGRIDIALLGLPIADLAGLYTVTVAESAFVALLPHGHPLAAREHTGGHPLVPSDLAGERFVDTPSGFGNRVIVDRAFDAAGVARRVSTETIDLTAVPGFVAAGLGVAIVPSLTLVRPPGVAVVPMDERGFSWLLTAAARGRHDRSPAVAAFVGLLDEQTGAAWPIGASAGQTDEQVDAQAVAGAHHLGG